MTGMGLLESNLVSFTRYEQSSQDSYGNYAQTVASGYPVENIAGYFEAKSGFGTNEADGLRVKRDAILLCPSYYDGKVGDFVSFSGTSYLVIGIRDNRRAVGHAHFEYSLLRREPGNRVVSSLVDPAVIIPR